MKPGPWIGCAAQWFAAVVGVYLMAASSLLGYDAMMAANVDRVIGPCVASFAIISAWEATAPVRRLNLLLGLALAIVQPILAIASDGGWASGVNGFVVGLVIIGLALVPYPRTHQFGGGWRGAISAKAPTA